MPPFTPPSRPTLMPPRQDGPVAGVGSVLGLDSGERAVEAALAALTQPVGPRERQADLEATLGGLWRTPVAIAPLGALSPLRLLQPLLAAGDVVRVAPELLARHRQAAGELRRAGWTVEAATPEGLASALAQAPAARTWYVAESAQPRDGRLASLEALWALHQRFEGLHVWLDDTHGLGWHGRGGRGLVLEQAPAGTRLVMSADLAPALGAELGAIASSDAAWLEAVRLGLGGAEPTGARLAAAAALAGRLASDGAEALQARLNKRLQICDRLLRGHRLPQLEPVGLPYRYVAMGEPAAAHAMVASLLEAGWLAGAATVATPHGPASAIRLAVSLSQPLEALTGLVEAVAERFEAALAYAGVDVEALREAHGLGAPAAPGTMVDLHAWRTSRLTEPPGSRMGS